MAWALACLIVAVVFGVMAFLPSLAREANTSLTISTICFALFLARTLGALPLKPHNPEDGDSHE